MLASNLLCNAIVLEGLGVPEKKWLGSKKRKRKQEEDKEKASAFKWQVDIAVHPSESEFSNDSAILRCRDVELLASDWRCVLAVLWSWAGVEGVCGGGGGSGDDRRCEGT
jgi:hypothetical protein